MSVSKKVSKKYDTKTWKKYHTMYAEDISDGELKELQFYLNFEGKTKSAWITEQIKKYLIESRNHWEKQGVQYDEERS